MCGTVSSENGSNSVLSLYIDGDLLFAEILPGEKTRKKDVPCGTRHAVFRDARGRVAADFCFSVPRGGNVILKPLIKTTSHPP